MSSRVNLSAAMGAFKNQLSWLSGLRATSPVGAQCCLLKAASLSVEVAEARNYIVRHALHSSAVSSRAMMYAARILQHAFPAGSVLIQQSPLTPPALNASILPPVLTLSPAARALLVQVSGFSPHHFELEGSSVCVDTHVVGAILDSLRALPPPADGENTGVADPPPELQPFMVSALVHLYVAHGLDYMLLADLERMLCELVIFGADAAFAPLMAATPSGADALHDYAVEDPLFRSGLTGADHRFMMVFRGLAPMIPQTTDPAMLKPSVWPPAMVRGRPPHSRDPPVCMLAHAGVLFASDVQIPSPTCRVHVQFSPPVATIVPPFSGAAPDPTKHLRARVAATVLWRVVSSATRWQLSFMYDGAKVQRGGIKQDAVQVLSQGCMPQVERPVLNALRDARGVGDSPFAIRRHAISRTQPSLGHTAPGEPSVPPSSLPTAKRCAFVQQISSCLHNIPLGVVVDHETPAVVKKHITDVHMVSIKLLSQWLPQAQVAPGLHFHLTPAGQQALVEDPRAAVDAAHLSCILGRDRTLAGEVPVLVLPTSDLFRLDMKVS